MPAGGQETARINKKNPPGFMADRSVGMPVNNTIWLVKLINKLVFEVVVYPSTVNEADGKTAKRDSFFSWHCFPAGKGAHVAMDGMYLFIGKYLEDTWLGKVPCMKNYRSVSKTYFSLFNKLWSYLGDII